MIGETTMNAEPTTATAPWPHMQVPAQRSAPPTPPPPVAKPVKAKRRWPWAVGGLALGLFIGSVSGAAGSSTSTVTAASAAPARTVTVTAPAPPPETITVTAPAAPPVQAEPPAAAPSGPLTTFGDGVWEVGVDVAAGKYKTAGPASGGIGMCYHARLKTNDGSLGDIIANNVSQGPVTVTIKPGDGYFETTGCQDWVKVG
jgi:hypothetical protein